MWTAIIGLAATVIGVIAKFIPGYQAKTPGDQKAADEGVTVAAMQRMDKAAAQPVNTKGKLGNGSF